MGVATWFSGRLCPFRFRPVGHWSVRLLSQEAGAAVWVPRRADLGLSMAALFECLVRAGFGLPKSTAVLPVPATSQTCTKMNV